MGHTTSLTGHNHCYIRSLGLRSGGVRRCTVLCSLTSKGRPSFRALGRGWGKKSSYYLLGIEVIILNNESQKGHSGPTGKPQHGTLWSKTRVSRTSEVPHEGTLGTPPPIEKAFEMWRVGNRTTCACSS